jgi:hypothetical protein
LREAARRLWRHLFPPVVELPEAAERRLAALFPTLDLRRVTFHRGLPWFAQRDVGGITLPGLLSPVHCRIYVQPYHWLPETDDGFSLLAHEAFHTSRCRRPARASGWSIHHPLSRLRRGGRASRWRGRWWWRGCGWSARLSRGWREFDRSSGVLRHAGPRQVRNK